MQALLEISGDIAESASVFDSDHFTSLKSLKAQLANYKNYTSVKVEINSGGGQAFEGFAMYDWLKSLNVPIETYGINTVGSIATAVFLAGDRRILAPHCQFFIHMPSGGATGKADELIAYGNSVKQIENKMIDMYLQHSSIDRDVLVNMMHAQTSLSSEQAASFGFTTFQQMPIAALKIDFTPISTTVNKKEKTLFEKIKALFAETITSLALTLTDGTAITVQTESDMPAVGDDVTLTETGEPAPDATHELPDGKKIVTAGGKITEIIMPQTTDDNTMTQEQAQALIDANKTLSAQLVALEEKYNAEVTASAKFRTTIEARLDTIVSGGKVTRDEDKDEPVITAKKTTEEEWLAKRDAKAAAKTAKK